MSEWKKEIKEIWLVIVDIARKRLKQLSNHKYKLIIAIIIIGPILLYLGHKLIEKIRSNKKPKIKLETSPSPRCNEDLPSTTLVRTDGHQIIESSSFINKPTTSSSSFIYNNNNNKIGSQQQVKSIPKWKRYVVFGWIHEMEKLLLLRDIPLGLIHIMLLYSKEEDYFQNTDDRFQLLNDNRTIKKLDKNGHRGIQLTHKLIEAIIFNWDIIKINVAVWKIQIDRISTKMVIACLDFNQSRYLFNIILRSRQSSKEEYGHFMNVSDYDEFVNDGDILTIRFNNKERDFQYAINDGELVNIKFDRSFFHDSDKVKFGVNLHGMGDCVSIIDFYTERAKRREAMCPFSDDKRRISLHLNMQRGMEQVYVDSDSE